MNQPSPCHLGGLSVLITRPAAQATPLAEAVEKAHGRPVRFPTIEILGPANKAAAKAAFAQIHQVDLLIFISANAVQYGYPLMPDSLPLNLPIAAIGRSTAQALRKIGLEPMLIPEQDQSSDGLLALPELQQVDGKHIWIVRGDGGRETLKQVLTQHGAQVEYIEVYRRQIPKRNPAQLIANWDRMVNIVTATSGTVLSNLFTLLGEAGESLIQTTPLVVGSQRIAEQARQMGCQSIYVAKSALDDDVMQALCKIARSKKSR